MWEFLAAALVDPVVWIFLLAGTFETLMGDPALHATLLFAVAAVLLGDAVRRRVRGLGPVPDTRREAAVRDARGAAWPWRVGAVIGGILFAVVVGSFRRYTPPVTLSVWAVGAPAIVWAWRVPPKHQEDRRLPPAGLLAWLGVLIGFAVWELIALFFQPSLSVNAPDHPTFSTLTDPLLAHPAGRILAVGAWLATGWYLLER